MSQNSAISSFKLLLGSVVWKFRTKIVCLRIVFLLAVGGLAQAAEVCAIYNPDGFGYFAKTVASNPTQSCQQSTGIDLYFVSLRDLYAIPTNEYLCTLKNEDGVFSSSIITCNCGLPDANNQNVIKCVNPILTLTSATNQTPPNPAPKAQKAKTPNHQRMS